MQLLSGTKLEYKGRTYCLLYRIAYIEVVENRELITKNGRRKERKDRDNEREKVKTGNYANRLISNKEKKHKTT